jgi:hypothetical protein
MPPAAMAAVSHDPGATETVRDSSEAITIHEWETPQSFSDEDDFKTYIRQYPESENHFASRLFRYTSGCPSDLMVALFDKFEFNRFSMIPKGASADGSRPLLNSSVGKCKCPKCINGSSCGQYALDFSISFWQHDYTIPDAENRLETTGGSDAFSVFSGQE